MFERFTDQARKVMALANSEAQRFNHECVGPEHILLALVKDTGNDANTILVGLDVDPRKVRLEVEKLLKPAPDLVTMGRLPHTPLAKLAVQRAIKEARELGTNHLGTAHLLLGLIDQQDNIASTVLAMLGVTRDRVLAHRFLALPLKARTMTHKIGNKYRIGNNIYLLALVDPDHVALLNMQYGTRLRDPVKSCSTTNYISDDEFAKVSAGSDAVQVEVDVVERGRGLEAAVDKRDTALSAIRDYGERLGGKWCADTARAALGDR